jgi:hypothetical protein
VNALRDTGATERASLEVVGARTRGGARPLAIEGACHPVARVGAPARRAGRNTENRIKRVMAMPDVRPVQDNEPKE